MANHSLFSGLNFSRGGANAGMQALFKGAKAPSSSSRAASSSSASALDFFASAPAAPAASWSAAAAAPEVEEVGEAATAAAVPRVTDSASEASAPRRRKRKRARKRDPPAPVDDVDVFGRSRSRSAKVTTEAEVASAATASTAASREHAEEQMRGFRTRMRIRVEGDDVPHPCATFDELMRCGEEADVDDARWYSRQFLLRNVEASRYKEPTAIQMQAIPAMLLRRDTLAVAPTGSGKTAAFLLPTLALLARSDGTTKRQSGAGPRSLLLAPTTELAAQLFREAERLRHGGGRHLRRCVLLNRARAAGLLQSAGPNEEKRHAAYDVDIAVSTPMRVVHLIRGGQAEDGAHVVKLSLARLEVLVLDEADKLFDLDFVEQMDEILSACGDGRSAGGKRPRLVRAMFSATLPQHVEQLARTVLQRPIRIVVGARGGSNTDIEQHLLFVGREHGKVMAVRQLLTSGRAAGGSSEVLGTGAAVGSGAACPPVRPPVLIFVQSKDRADELFAEIVYDGFNVACVHSGVAKKAREKILRDFRLGRIWVVIATELMGRGLDFKGVSCVINYDLPLSTVAYVHRVGRTGRAGRRGLAVTLFTESDMRGALLRPIANVAKLSGSHVPAWILGLQKTRRGEDERKRLAWGLQGAPKRRSATAGTSGITRDELKRRARKRNMAQMGKHRPEGEQAVGENGKPVRKAKGKKKKKRSKRPDVDTGEFAGVNPLLFE